MSRNPFDYGMRSSQAAAPPPVMWGSNPQQPQQLSQDRMFFPRASCCPQGTPLTYESYLMNERGGYQRRDEPRPITSYSENRYFPGGSQATHSPIIRPTASQLPRQEPSYRGTPPTMQFSQFNAVCPICNESIMGTTLDEHYKQKHIPVPCELCGEMNLIADMANHREKYCPETPVLCEFCHKKIPRKNKDMHERECEPKTIECPTCHLQIPSRMFVDHIVNLCRLYQMSQMQIPASPSPVQVQIMRESPFSMQMQMRNSQPPMPMQVKRESPASVYGLYGEPAQIQRTNPSSACGPSSSYSCKVPGLQQPVDYDSSCEWPKCHQMFSVTDIVQHCENCGIPSVQLQLQLGLPQQTTEKIVPCLWCKKMFTVTEIFQHSENCRKTVKKEENVAVRKNMQPEDILSQELFTVDKNEPDLDSLKCPICFLTVNNPVCHDICGKTIFCAKCVASLRECPICHREIGESSHFVPVPEMLDRSKSLRVKCNFCDREMTLEAFRNNHQMSCITPCPSCGRTVSIGTLKDHLTSGDCKRNH